MRSVLAFAAVALVAAVVTPKLASHIGATKPAHGPLVRGAAAKPDPITHTSRFTTVRPDAQGHFRVQARVDGQPLDFIVDTGASVIALTETDAARLGRRPMLSEYTATVTTANGTAKAAPMRLREVEIDGVMVRDVSALVLPDNSLSENLLGMSFLSRLRRYEVSDGRLVLEQ